MRSFNGTTTYCGARKKINDKWFVVLNASPFAKVRLICLPYAGGSATTYTPWSRYLCRDIELISVQLPGRGSRFREPPYHCMRELVDDLYINILPLLDKPYVLFGHSLGSRIGFELLKKIQIGKQKMPNHFIASGSRAPHLGGNKPPIFNLAYEEFVEELRRYNGTPKAVLENKELLELVLPALRADFELAETFISPVGMIIDCGLSIFSGKDDLEITEEDLLAWEFHFSYCDGITMLDGNHFFVESSPRLVAEKVAQVVSASVIETTE